MVDLFKLEILYIGDDSELGGRLFLICISFANDEKLVCLCFFNHDEKLYIPMVEGQSHHKVILSIMVRMLPCPQEFTIVEERGVGLLKVNQTINCIFIQLL